jgi:ABC-type glutathione transport system ATPase component
MVDPKAVAEALLDRVMRAAHADTGSVLLMHEEDGRLRIVAAEGLPADVTASTRLAPGEGIAGWVYSTGKATVVEDLQRPDKTGRHGVRSSIAVPLADEDGVIGVVNVGSRRFEARQAQPLIEALEALCGIGVVALRNAQASRDQREVQFSTLRALALALETKDPHARGTTDRVHDLAIALGRFVGITGASGSGKSTLMNLLGGLDTPTSGSLRVEERQIGALSKAELALYRRHTVGMIFQSFNLVPSYTAAENVAFPLLFAGVGKRQRLQQATEILRALG